MDSAFTHERLRGVAGELLPRACPALTAAISVALVAAAGMRPTAIDPNLVIAALVLNALLAAAGSAAAAYLGGESAGRTVVAAIGLAALGVVRHLGYAVLFAVLAAAAVLIYYEPSLLGVAIGIAIIYAMARHASR